MAFEPIGTITRRVLADLRDRMDGKTGGAKAPGKAARAFGEEIAPVLAVEDGDHATSLRGEIPIRNDTVRAGGLIHSISTGP